ncbi:unnamed protein product [Brachionus calyciflorus]|uniref:Kynureninase n=1 Tax=Brachionus calyciflorus TaxID=104777 RepID=A0A813YZ10_9BILA|nr:unnamed protein product [Brachionus calyciflorus]
MVSYFSLRKPIDDLTSISYKTGINILDEEFSHFLDQSFPSYRSKFHYPKLKNLKRVDFERFEDTNQECIYFCGHSLGLQPIETKLETQKFLDKWANLGVTGHFDGDDPWVLMEEKVKPLMADLVGAKKDEIGIMNSLTVNLNLLLISFYQPIGKRTKILLEDNAFPSDHYTIESQLKLHNLEPKDHMICLKPREGEFTLRKEDILSTIEEKGDDIALVLFSGIQYFTGQLFPIQEISEAVHKKGCKVGFDLAHAVGNVKLKLHDWKVDFAVWCTYKYLNSGPGGIGAIFLHENNFDYECKKLDGWWGHDLNTRFLMTNKMEYSLGASKYSMSTPPSILINCLATSLKIFKEANFDVLVNKSIFLTAYLEYLLERKINDSNSSLFEQITPKCPLERGAHISIRFSRNVSIVYEELKKSGVLCDFRSPNVLRFSPTPLYNTFKEVFDFVEILNKCLQKN